MTEEHNEKLKAVHQIGTSPPQSSVGVRPNLGCECPAALTPVAYNSGSQL